VRDVKLANASDLAQTLLTAFNTEHRDDSTAIDRVHLDTVLTMGGVTVPRRQKASMNSCDERSKVSAGLADLGRRRT
jgi:hypothetical protein